MKRYITILIIGVSLPMAQGQSFLSYYNFNALPQSLASNPAYPQQAVFYISLPSVNTQYINNGFKLSDLVSDRETELGDLNEDGVYDVNDNMTSIINTLDGTHQININNSIDLFGFGFKAKKGFFHAGITQQTDYLMDYPVDLLRFLWGGNQQFLGDEFSLATFDFEAVTRTNFYAGYQRWLLNDRLMLGMRFKYIIGQANAYVERSDISIEQPDEFTMNIKTDVLVRTGGLQTLFDGDDITDFTFSDNTGSAVDLGFYYKLTDKINVSASLVDLGSITWQDGNTEYVSNGEYTYDGFDLDFGEDQDDPFGQTLDSLEAALNITDRPGEQYKRKLIRQFYAAVNYELTEKHAFGLLYHNRSWSGETFHDVGVNYVGRLSRLFQLTASYSIVNGVANNVGAGIQLKLGPAQIYVLSDNILGVTDYGNLQNMTVSAGVNLTIFESRRKIRERKKREAQEKMENKDQEMEQQESEEERNAVRDGGQKTI